MLVELKVSVPLGEFVICTFAPAASVNAVAVVSLYTAVEEPPFGI